VSVWVGRVLAVRETPAGREATVSVRGARSEVLLDVVPEARVGDSVLVDAGVALAVLVDGPEPETASPSSSTGTDGEEG
jgi:hydrogenase maturation factor